MLCKNKPTRKLEPRGIPWCWFTSQREAAQDQIHLNVPWSWVFSMKKFKQKWQGQVRTCQRALGLLESLCEAGATDHSLCTKLSKALFKSPSCQTSQLNQNLHCDDYVVLDTALVCETWVWKIFINHLPITRPKYRWIGHDLIHRVLSNPSFYLRISLPMVCMKIITTGSFALNWRCYLQGIFSDMNQILVKKKETLSRKNSLTP